MAKNKKLIIFIPSIEDGGVEKNLFIISNYLIKKIENITLITYDNSQILKSLHLFLILLTSKVDTLNIFFA